MKPSGGLPFASSASSFSSPYYRLHARGPVLDEASMQGFASEALTLFCFLCVAP